ncbi:MAG TPA: ABC transporter substrate-binding protein [Ramlibacter sp.]|nr:ABC transporter substrate-binding protein [Ramlibacter sp.]
MNFKNMLITAAVLGTGLVQAQGQSEYRIGVVASMSGVYGIGGKQLQNGINAFLKVNGDQVAGKKVVVIYRDTGGPNPDVAKRVAQELLSQDKVDALAGFDFTPSALAVAPLATQAKKPMIVMNAATSVITTRSPFIVRTSFTTAQTSFPLGQWAFKNGLKNVYITVADFAPGQEAATWFKKAFTEAGGKIVGEAMLPITSFDYGPFLQKVRDEKPDAVFAFLPVGEPVILYYKSWAEKGLGKAGVKLISPEGWVDPDVLRTAGAASLGAISSGFYTPSNPSPLNKSFLAAYRSVAGDKIDPNYLAVGAYDGMAVVYEALKKTGGSADGEKVVEAMKGLKLYSPRGSFAIDPETRDVINTVYVRKVEMVSGNPVAVDFDKFESVKDMGKPAR